MIRRIIERCCGKAKADRIVHWWCNPEKGFWVIFVFVILFWISIPVALTWQLSNWNDAMLEERMYLKEDSARQKKHIQILQELLDRHIGERFFD